MATTVYTVGHSNRPQAALFALLAEAGIRTLVDVRARPHSRRFPHFSGDALRLAAEQAGIAYHWAGRQLGGMRPARPDSPHLALPEGVRGFADHMASEAFGRALAQLIDLAEQAPTAMMCAERLPEHCHRALIADFLAVRGAQVLHLVEPGEMRPHRLNPHVRMQGDALIYDTGRQVPLDLH